MSTWVPVPPGSDFTLANLPYGVSGGRVHVAIGDHENLVQNHFAANVCRYLFYFQFFAGAHAILLATGFYDRIHGRPR